MTFREANDDDIQQMHSVRTAVIENPLPDPGMITTDDYREFINDRGKGWVCEIDNSIVGFAIADLKESNIWALFVHPQFEKRGIARTLQQFMLDWYFAQGHTSVWLGTAFGTRAEQFYRKTGWIHTGFHGTKEIKFEMTAARWEQLRHEVT